MGLVFGTFPPARNGGADFVGHFARALGARGARVTVLTSAGEPARAEIAPGVVVHRLLEDWRIRRGAGRLSHANALLRAEGVELLHVFFPDSVLQGRYQAPVLLRLGGIPLVTTFWNIGLGRRSPLSIKAEAAALLVRSAALTTHDPTYLGALRRVALRRPVRWLPVGNNIGEGTGEGADVVRARLGMAAGPLLGYFGHLDFTRGIEDLLAILATLREGGMPAQLAMLGGSGDRREPYEALARRLGVADAVHWVGYLPAEQLADALAALDLCVLPYRRNSIGRSALAAALSLGVPTVVAGTAAGVQPLEPGRHIALVPRGDPAAAAGVIRRLLDEPGELERLRDGAREAAKFFEWPRIAGAALELYDDLLA